MKKVYPLLFFFILAFSCDYKERSYIESQIKHRIDKGSGGALQILDLYLGESKENKFLDGAIGLTVPYKVKVKATAACDLRSPLDRSYGHIPIAKEFEITDTIVFVQVGDGLWSTIE
jgi:hypothetical protein